MFTSLSTLELEGNYFGDKVLHMLLQGMKYNFGIKFLNLSQNNISKLGAKYLKNYLRDNSTLRILLLHWNSLGTKGNKRIAKAISQNTVLQVLDLSFC